MTNRIKVLDINLFSIGQIQAIDASTRLFEVQDHDNYRGLACHDGQVVGAVLYGDMQLMGPLREAVEQGQRVQELSDLCEYFPGLQQGAGRPRYGILRTGPKCNEPANQWRALRRSAINEGKIFTLVQSSVNKTASATSRNDLRLSIASFCRRLKACGSSIPRFIKTPLARSITFRDSSVS